MAVAFHWPDAPLIPQGFNPRYYENAVIGWTEGRGDVAIAFGGESHIGPDGGPYHVWVFDGGGKVGSDKAGKIGWWDDHIIPNPIFEITRKEGEQPPPQNGTEYLCNVNQQGEITGHIAFLPGAPPSGDAGLVLMRNDRVVAYIPWQSR